MSTSAPAAAIASPRLTSLDQFRGYTMLGMLLVNFLGGYAICPKILKHTHDYCSYADTIMPQFLFAAGFAMRLSLGKRLAAGGGKMPWVRAIRRVFGLALVAILWYSFGDLWSIINRFKTQPVDEVLYALFKRSLFQTLLHIAATSFWILPVIAMSWRVRLGYMIASGLLHVVISWWFNYAWVYSDPTGIDGGPLGFLSWAVPALCGTLACDAVKASGTKAAGRIALCGAGVMLLGWGMTIPTTLYNVHAPANPNEPPAATPVAATPVAATAVAPAAETPPSAAAPAAESTLPAAASPAGDGTNGSTALPDGTLEEKVSETPSDPKPADAKVEAPATPPPVPAPTPAPTPEKKPYISKLDPKKYAPDPVLPTMERIRAWDGTLVEPPFVPPPSLEGRKWNYWMMSQRGGTLPYPTFAAGFSLVVFAFFLVLSDVWNIRIGLFRTLGTNSLAAYILHDIAGWTIEPYFPKSSSAAFALFGFFCFTLFVYGICRLFERLGWYLRV